MAEALTTARIAKAAPLFAALGDPTRLQVVVRLASGGPESIARLAKGADVTRQAVTKHLHVLEGAGLVHGRREGRRHVYELTPARLDEARGYLERIDAHWDAALERLRAHVEDGS